MREPISGRDASILALLAQRAREDLSEADMFRILNELDGPALKIAEVMLGRRKNASKSLKAAADGFTEWADKL